MQSATTLDASTAPSRSHLGAGSGQKVVDLLVDVDSPLQIGDTSDLSLDQVITVHGGRDGGGRESSGHELQEGHLRAQRR
jgi:hypothetical protein